MTFRHSILLSSFLVLSVLACAADTTLYRAGGKKRINLIVSTRLTGIDPAGIAFQLQAGWRRLFNRKRFYTVYVDSIEEASARISGIMVKEDAMLGNLWFDSHGHLGRRVALVEVGKDEVNYLTIRDPFIMLALQKIAVYCDTNTRIGLGSCYSGADFTLPAVEIFPEQRMNGDSLMISMSRIMNNATVFGAKSWVMTKPGIFTRSYAMAGHPWRKRFKDPYLEKPWEELGVWTMYDGRKNSMSKVNTVTLDHRASIENLSVDFLDIPRNVEKQKNKIKKIRAGNFSHKWFYKFQYPRHVSAMMNKYKK